MQKTLQFLKCETAFLKKIVKDNPTPEELIADSLKLDQGILAKSGALVVKTGECTGRSAKDKYIVKDARTENAIWWENDVHQMSADAFDKIWYRVSEHLNARDQLYYTNRSVGADQEHALAVRLLTSSPVSSLFSQNMFLPAITDKKWEESGWSILHAPDLEIPKDEFNLRDKRAIISDFSRRLVIIFGTAYNGEIKKSVFSIMNFLLPDKGILPMHAGASLNQNNEVSVFFGLSGTGKTTLSTDTGTKLIGDDEHGLHAKGIFNFENGCYAKTIALSEKTEPEIYRACQRRGAILENVVIDPKTLEVDFDSQAITENGRASYPLSFLDNVKKDGTGPMPKQFFYLTCDAYGVLPAASILDETQALEFFLLGYTAKVAGTEAGITEPQKTFSACFGAPFMIRKPQVYGQLLKEYVKENNIQVWLINTGWYQGEYGKGERFPLKVTRQIIRSIQAGKYGDKFETDPIFNVKMPKEIEGVDFKQIYPKLNWSDVGRYEKKATELSQSFKERLKKVSF